MAACDGGLIDTLKYSLTYVFHPGNSKEYFQHKIIKKFKDIIQDIIPC